MAARPTDPPDPRHTADRRAGGGRRGRDPRGRLLLGQQRKPSPLLSASSGTTPSGGPPATAGAKPSTTASAPAAPAKGTVKVPARSRPGSARPGAWSSSPTAPCWWPRGTTADLPGRHGQTHTVTPVGTVPGVPHTQGGENGLLGLALSPDYGSDHLVYAYFSTESDNRIASMLYDPTRPKDEQLGRARHHPAGHPHRRPPQRRPDRLRARRDALRRDRRDRGAALAQNMSSLGGKILRMTPDGQVPAGQPDPRVARLLPRAPQRPGAGLGRGRAAVGLGVRAGHLGRTEPDPAGQELRLADGRGHRPPRGLRRPGGAVAHRRRIAQRDRLRGGLHLDGRAQGRAPVAHPAGRGQAVRRAPGVPQQEVRPAPYGRRARRPHAAAHHEQHRRPRHPAPGDDRILRLTVLRTKAPDGRRPLPVRGKSWRRWASAAASVRVETVSLARMLETWTLAVFGRDEELLGDLPVGAAVGDQPQHVAFAGGEAEGRDRVGSGTAVRSRARLGERLDRSTRASPPHARPPRGEADQPPGLLPRLGPRGEQRLRPPQRIAASSTGRS